MAGRDLRALFSSNDPRITADEAFTNREGQWQAFVAALTEHLRHVAAPGFDVEDVEAPRENIVVFHGVGGIGKTSLSRKLEAALTRSEHRPPHWGEPTLPEWILPVRIDLARTANTDFEHVILALRLALCQIGRPLPAFDIALRHYWERQHPGESLEEYLRRGGLTARFGKALPEHLQSALGEVAQTLELPGMVGSAVGQVTRALVRALRERRRSVRALAGCTRLADLLEAEPDLDALSFYPHLLAWELARLPAGKQVVPVILLDTFEDVGDRTHRDAERLIQRMVWLMPNCFFAITGRNRLQWADPALHGQLDWTGPQAWPGLATHSIPSPRPVAGAASGGRHILIGDFSRGDCEGYLARRLTHDGRPLIPDDLRAVIADRSHGLPLYLDLAVMRFLELRRTGTTPQAADFDVDFPALIARTLSDLTPDERHVLRSVSLLDAFDVDLATQSAGTVHDAPVLRLLERPFIHEDPFALWPYHLHALVRSTIRSATDATDDHWSSRDWQHAAARAFAALGQQWATGTASGRVLLIGCLRQGLALARDFRLDLGWLTEATWTYISDSVWEPLDPPARHDQAGALDLETAADALVELLSALARRQHEHRERTADRLTTVIATRLLPAELHEMAIYYRAKAERDLGRSQASRTGMQQVVDGGGRLAPAARRGLAHLARLAGDFPTALAAAEALGWEGRHHRVLGDVWWPHGDVARAAAHYEAARTEAEEHGIAGEHAIAQTQRAFTLAFTDPTLADDEIDLAQQLLAGLVLRGATLTAHVATLIRDAGSAEDLDQRAETLRADSTAAGLPYTQPAIELALCFHHAIRDDHPQLATAIARLRELTRGGDYAYYADIACFMGRLPLPAEPGAQARWLDGEQPTRDRWRALVTNRREHLRTAV